MSFAAAFKVSWLREPAGAWVDASSWDPGLVLASSSVALSGPGKPELAPVSFRPKIGAGAGKARKSLAPVLR